MNVFSTCMSLSKLHCINSCAVSFFGLFFHSSTTQDGTFSESLLRFGVHMRRTCAFAASCNFSCPSMDHEKSFPWAIRFGRSVYMWPCKGAWRVLPGLALAGSILFSPSPWGSVRTGVGTGLPSATVSYRKRIWVGYCQLCQPKIFNVGHAWSMTHALTFKIYIYILTHGSSTCVRWVDITQLTWIGINVYADPSRYMEDDPLNTLDHIVAASQKCKRCRLLSVLTILRFFLRDWLKDRRNWDHGRGADLWGPTVTRKCSR